MSNSCQLGQLRLLPKKEDMIRRTNNNNNNSNNGDQVKRALRGSVNLILCKKKVVPICKVAKVESASLPIWRSCCCCCCRCGCHLDKHLGSQGIQNIECAPLEMESNAMQPLRLLVVPTQQITCKLDGKMWKAGGVREPKKF